LKIACNIAAQGGLIPALQVHAAEFESMLKFDISGPFSSDETKKKQRTSILCGNGKKTDLSVK